MNTCQLGGGSVMNLCQSLISTGMLVSAMMPYQVGTPRLPRGIAADAAANRGEHVEIHLDRFREPGPVSCIESSRAWSSAFSSGMKTSSDLHVARSRGNM